MKAAVLYRSGGAENLLLEERDIPPLQADRVLVKVMAFGLNRSEIMTRKGYCNFPFLIGYSSGISHPGISPILDSPMYGILSPFFSIVVNAIEYLCGILILDSR